MASNHPWRVVIGSFIILLVIITAFMKFGKGFIYMSGADSESISLSITSRDSLSIQQKDAIVNEVYEELKGLKGIESITSRAFNDNSDYIGNVIIELEKWDKRPLTYKAILNNIDEKTKHIYGVKLRKNFARQGPNRAPKILLYVKGSSVVESVNYIIKKLKEDPELEDIKDNLNSNFSALVYNVDKVQAARFGLDVLTIGNTINWLLLG